MVERFYMWLAWKLPPRLAMWAYFRIFAFATQGVYGSTDCSQITAMEVIKRWEPLSDPRRPRPPEE